MIKFSPQLC